MGLSGRVAGGFQRGLVEEMTRQALEAARAQQAELERARLDESIRSNQAGEGLRARQIDLGESELRERRNRAGVEDMTTQRSLMDEDEDKRAIDAMANDPNLPPQVRTIVGLKRRGISGISPDDLMDPEQKLQGDVKRAGAIADAQARAAARYRQPSSAAQDQQWVVRNGQPVPIPKGTAQPGDRPYDPVAERQTANNSLDPKAADETRQQILTAAQDLLKHPGLDAFTGTTFNPQHGFGWYDDPIGGTDAAGAKALYDNFVSLSALPNLEKLRGPLSDKDIEFIKSASTRAKPRSKDTDFRRELQAIVTTLSNAQGGGTQTTASPQVGAEKVFPNGKRGRWDGKGWVLVP